MTTTATRPRPLPVVLYFSGDVAARKAIKGILNFTCAAWRSGTSHHKKGAVLLSSCERTLHEH